jgi:hypothetical protein
MVSPHIIDIRWRIAAEEKAKRQPPAQPPWRNWYARKLDDKWCIVQHIPDHRGNARVEAVTQAEFDEVNARYLDD